MIIGLTGGIGSGKSTVAKLLEIMGMPVYNSDNRAKELYFVPEIKKQVTDLLGNEAYLNENSLNKEYISKRIFSDTTMLARINAIIHPAVEKDFNEFCRQNSQQKHIVKETALLFEAGIYKKVNKIILVTAPAQVRIDRVIKRDKVNAEEVIRRINNQMPEEEKIPISDFVIVNDEKESLILQVLRVVESLNNV